MELILLPHESRPLDAIYRRAVSHADQLYLYTAYLTAWSFPRLNQNCKKLEIYFGTDFAITRKKALYALLRWLPGNQKCSAFAIEEPGFHPKLLVWRESAKYFAVIGSSNLTGAGFSTNIEANHFMQITPAEFSRVIEWGKQFQQFSHALNEDWIKRYKEAARKPTTRPKAHKVAHLIPLPRLTKEELADRRWQVQQFRLIAKPLNLLVRQCAASKVSNLGFWDRMYYDLFGQSDARIQGRGFEISGRSANWKQICRSMLRIFAASLGERDFVVKTEIDRLGAADNPARGAWFTEILSHYYPKEYPILNKPSHNWLSASQYRRPRGASEGAEYIDIASKFRQYLAQSRQFRNLLELDHAVWKKYPRQP